MDIKCGIDIIKDERLQKNTSDEGFMKRVFHHSETGQKDIKKLSSIFTLKESLFKALEITPPKWLEAEVRYKPNGKTLIVLSEEIRPKDLVSIDSSVSHENGYTIGKVVLLFENESDRPGSENE